jgi:hypothetical protein
MRRSGVLGLFRRSGGGGNNIYVFCIDLPSGKFHAKSVTASEWDVPHNLVY